MQVAKDGGPTTTLASDPKQPYANAVDDESVYWGANDFVIQRVPIGGGASTTIAAGRAEAIVVDATSVHWSDNDRHAILKVTPK